MPELRRFKTFAVLVRSVIGFCCAALSAGLSAHLVAASTSHDGAGRDLVILSITAGLAVLLLRRAKLRRTALLPLVLATASVAFGWLLLEHSTHIAFAELMQTCVALVAVLLALVQIVLLGVEVVALLTPMIHAFRPRRVAAPPAATYLRSLNHAASHLTNLRRRIHLRRGPPARFDALIPVA